MRFSDVFARFQHLCGPEKGPKAHRITRQSVDSALLAVDDADRRGDHETGVPEGVDGICGRSAGGHDVLDEAHALPLLVDAFERLPVP
jgi:hypothetical protein